VEEDSLLEWKTLRLNGRAVAYGEAGRGNSVVFLHGWGLDHRAYKRALSRLVAAGTHVIAPALPGFGGSDKLEADRTTILGFASWLDAFLDALGLESPVIVLGHSFGGAVAIAFAHGFPERVKALVLINSVGASAWTHKGTALLSMAERPLWDWGVHLSEDLLPLRQMRRVLPVLLSEAGPNFLRDPMSFVHVAGLARYADLTEELQEHKERELPIIVLWGRRDRIVTRQSFEQMCQLAGSVQSITVEGGHAWLIVDANTFGEVMTNVLDIVSKVHPAKRRLLSRWRRSGPRRSVAGIDSAPAPATERPVSRPEPP